MVLCIWWRGDLVVKVSPHHERTSRCLQDLNLPVVGSQIVGLIPLKAVLDSADFYINRDRLFIIEEEHKVRLVRT